MKILLIEDDEEKISDLINFFKENYSNAGLIVAKSFHAGLREVSRNHTRCDLLLLDMSMPSHDQPNQQGGTSTPESYAGRDMLAQMKLRKISLPTIVVTMFATFGKDEQRKTFEQLDTELSTRFAPTYRGMVRYNKAQEGWQDALSKLIRSVLEEK